MTRDPLRLYSLTGTLGRCCAAGLRAGHECPVRHACERGVDQSLDLLGDQTLLILLWRQADAVVRRVEVQRAELVEAQIVLEIDLLDRRRNRSRKMLLSRGHDAVVGRIGSCAERAPLVDV